MAALAMLKRDAAGSRSTLGTIRYGVCRVQNRERNVAPQKLLGSKDNLIIPCSRYRSMSPWMEDIKPTGLSRFQYHRRNAKTPAAKQMLDNTFATITPETMRRSDE